MNMATSLIAFVAAHAQRQRGVRSKIFQKQGLMKKQYSLIKFRGSTWGGSILALILLITSIQPAAAVVGVVQRVSVDSSAAQVNGPSTSPSISDDGLMVAFASTASNLIVPGDTNGVSDIFLRNRDSGVTTRISTGPGGLQANGASDAPSISADGAFVAFRSEATNLVANDTNNKSDIFLRDVYGGTTTRISVASDGTQANENSYAPSISANGRYVTYFSYANNLTYDASNGADVFVYDRTTGQTEMVSLDSNETQGNGESSYPSISGDGRFVAFQSSSTNLVPEDTADRLDVFVRDRTLGETFQVSVSSNEDQGAGNSNNPVISDNGLFVAFESSSFALVTPPDVDNNGSVDILVRDIANGTTTRASLNVSGINRPGSSTQASISSDGRYVAFSSYADLINYNSSANSYPYVYVRDMLGNVTKRVSVSSGGTLGNDASEHPSITGDGHYVVFDSVSTNLISEDTNLVSDIFFADTVVDDAVAPLITSFTRLTPTNENTNYSTLVFRATFNEAVQGVDAADFAVTATPAATVEITGVSSFSASEYDITVLVTPPTDYTGVIGLDFSTNPSIADMANNAFENTEPGIDQTYAVDYDVPDVSITGGPPAFTHVSSATIYFSSSDPQATFICSLTQDDEFYTPCVSGTQHSGLGQDTWTFYVKAVDPAGNTSPAATWTWVVDWTAPYPLSIERSAPATSPTNWNTLTFRVTFDNDVTGVDILDFQSTVPGVNVSEVSAFPNSIFYVTLSGTTLEEYDGDVELTFSTSPSIEDRAGNDLTDTSPISNQTYWVDNTPPTLTSFTYQTPTASPTNANELIFQAHFSEDVTGVGIGNFTVDGSSTAGVTAVAAVSGSAQTYAVTVSGGDLNDFNGNVGLNLNASGIADMAGNALTAGEPSTDLVYFLDNTAPRATSFAYYTPDSSPTNATTLVYQVTFSETVSLVGTNDFTVTGGSGAGVTSVTGGGTTYYVTIAGGSLSTFTGDVNLNFVASPTIEDAVGNLLTNTTPTSEEIYAVDHTAPTITHIRFNSPTTNPTNADSLTYEVIFSESVSGVQITDFVVNGGGIEPDVSMTGSGATYLVTISGEDLVSFNGDVNLDLIAAPGISDEVGNFLINTLPGSEEIYHLDNTAPSTISFTYQTPSTSPTNEDSLVFRVIFSEAVQNIGPDDFAVDSTITGLNIVVTGSGDTYAVTVSGSGLENFNGSVGLNFDTPDIIDLAGNSLPNSEPSPDQEYWLDNEAPAALAFALHNPLTSPTNANSLTFRVTFSEDVTGVTPADFAATGVSGVTLSVDSVSDSVYDVTLSGGNLESYNGEVGLNFNSPTIQDLAGNPLPNLPPNTKQSYLLDNNVPTAISFTYQNPATSPTNANSLTFQVIFSEAVTGVDIGDFVKNSDSTANVSAVNGSGTTYTVTISGGDLASFNGTVGLNLANSPSMIDAAGNNVSTAEPTSGDDVYLVDNLAPATTSFIRLSPPNNPTNANSLTFQVTFSEAVKGVEAADFAADATTATVTAFSQVSATAYSVTISGGTLTNFTGDVGLTFAAGMQITDLADNPLPSTAPVTNQRFTLDNLPPAILSIVRQSPTASLTNLNSLTFRATFSEAVSGVGAADFAATGVSGITIGVNPVSSTVYDITLSGGDLAGFNGVVGLNIPASVDIVDGVGNALPAANPSTNQTYTLDNEAPTVIIDTFPADPTSEITAIFEFHSPDGGTAYECQRDETGYSTCDSGVSYSGLAEGSHTFSVRATDDAGNQGAAATYTWEIDLTAPTVTITSHPDSRTNSTTAIFGFSGEYVVSFTCSLDGAVATTCTSSKEYTGLAAGPHTFHVYGVDSSGNQGGDSYTWTIDLTPPSAVSFLRSVPADELTNEDSLVFQVTFSEDVTGVGTGDFAVNGSTTASVTGVDPVSATVYLVTVSEGDLADFNGEVGLNFAALPNIVDNAGNALNKAEPGMDETYFVDNQAPQTIILTHPNALSSSNSATFTFSGTDNESSSADLTFECSLDGGPVEDCASPKTYTNLVIGEHTFSVWAKDELGHVDATPATFTWMVAHTVFLPVVVR